VSVAPAISVRGIVKDFGEGETKVRALHGIDLDISPGELTFLVGESGSGKTTLISIVAGIMYPTEGSVCVFDTPIYDLSEDGLVTFRLNNIGFIFQQYNLIPTLTAAENASVPLVAAGVTRADAVDRARATLESLNIGQLADRFPRQMSGGQQQRVAIARALVHEPRLIVCDEPTAALDASAGRRVMDLLGQVAIQSDRAVIIVTHDNRVFDLADRIVEMEDGRIVSDRRPDKAKPMELVH
jgi:putative ABC transport system ATP-binding protein